MIEDEDLASGVDGWDVASPTTTRSPSSVPFDCGALTGSHRHLGSRHATTSLRLHVGEHASAELRCAMGAQIAGDLCAGHPWP